MEDGFQRASLLTALVSSPLVAERLYLFRFCSRICTPWLLQVLCSWDVMDCSAVFTSAATDGSQLFSRLEEQSRIRLSRIPKNTTN